jgi:signal transduction histidine kinase
MTQIETNPKRLGSARKSKLRFLNLRLRVEREGSEVVDPRVSTESNENGDVLTIVEDSGSGIDLQVLDCIFDPMFTTKPEGMGLGLSICRSIVEGHGGRLWVSPNPAGGSIFQFSIPDATTAVSIEARNVRKLDLAASEDIL